MTSALSKQGAENTSQNIVVGRIFMQDFSV